MADYDFERAFARVEDELLRSMIRNMKKHSEWEDAEGFNWSMWQAEQLKALDKYKQDNKKKFSKQFSQVNSRIKEAIEEARKDGNMAQEIEILKALWKGYKPPKSRSGSVKTQAAFFRLNDRKMDALISATIKDMERAETAVLRMANDKYRKIIFDAQVYANSGAGTYEKAVDMATRDFLVAGLNCVEYANGARHTLKNYAMMAIRTASKRAYLQGEGEKRQEWGISTVIVNKRGNPCPKCLPFCGKVLVDDVWSGGKKGDGPYPLLSSAIAAGLYHPNCKDSHTTYFLGISTPPDGKITTKEISTVKREYTHEQRQQYIERQVEKYDRLEKYSLDSENQERYAWKLAEWEDKADSLKGKKIEVQAEYNAFIRRLREDSDSQKNKMALYAEFTELREDLNCRAPLAYDIELDAMIYNPKLSLEGYDLDYSFAHELSHRIDSLEYHSWENDNFIRAIEICSGKVYAEEERIREWFKPGGEYERSFAISDIVSALSNAKISGMVGHSERYWSNPKLKAVEIFANLNTIETLNLLEKKELNSIFDELFKAYKEIVG